MGLFQRLRHAIRTPIQNTVTPMSLEEMLRHLIDRDARSISGVHVTPQRAEGIAPVGICVRILTSTMSHLPLVLMRQVKDRREPDTANALYGLLHDQPNEWQTAMQFRELMQRDLELRGNAYARIIRGVGGRIVELLRLHPNQVVVKQDERMKVTYEYTRGDGTRIILQRVEVFHICGPGDDGITGRSPITVHRETMGDAIAMQEHGSRFFSNGAKPLGVFTQTPGATLSQESKDFLKADLAELHTGTENAHKSLLLPAGLDYKPVSISMEDAQYIEGRKFTRTEIFGIFGVPPHKGADLEKATFTNIEHQALEFVMDAIVPRCVRWEQAIKRDLLEGDPKRYAKHNVNALLRGDAKSRNEALQIQRRNGVISANEWRELDDMNPRTDEGGKAYITEANMKIDDGKPPEGPENAPKTE